MIITHGRRLGKKKVTSRVITNHLVQKAESIGAAGRDPGTGRRCWHGGAEDDDVGALASRIFFSRSHEWTRRHSLSSDERRRGGGEEEVDRVSGPDVGVACRPAQTPPRVTRGALHSRSRTRRTRAMPPSPTSGAGAAHRVRQWRRSRQSPFHAIQWA